MDGGCIVFGLVDKKLVWLNSEKLQVQYLDLSNILNESTPWGTYKCQSFSINEDMSSFDLSKDLMGFVIKEIPPNSILHTKRKFE